MKYGIYEGDRIETPAQLLDHILRVASNFGRKFDGVDASYDQRVCLHRISAGERRTDIHTYVHTLGLHTPPPPPPPSKSCHFKRPRIEYLHTSVYSKYSARNYTVLDYNTK